MASTPTPTHANRGLLRTGDELPDGAVITAVSLTAYEVFDHERGLEWRSFDQVHGRPPAVMPLVTFE